MPKKRAVGRAGSGKKKRTGFSIFTRHHVLIGEDSEQGRVIKILVLLEKKMTTAGLVVELEPLKGGDDLVSICKSA